MALGISRGLASELQRTVQGDISMSMRISGKRSTSRRRGVEGSRNRGKMVLDVDLNDYPEGAPAPDVTISPPSQPIEPQGVTVQRANVLIDIEAIDDEVTVLSSSRRMPRVSQSRSVAPETIVIDEDTDDHPGRSEIGIDEPATSPTLNSYYGHDRNLLRTVINCDSYESLESNHIPKRKRVENIVESKNTEQESTLNCSKNMESSEPTLKCSICWNPLSEATSTSCGHIFCQECIKSSIRAQKKCPSCRKSLTMKSIHRIYLPSAN